MRIRIRAVLAAGLVGLLLAVLVIVLGGALGEREAAVPRAPDGLSLAEEKRIVDGRIGLSNYCTAAITAARGQAPPPPPPQTQAARGIVEDLLRLAREDPSAYISDIGSLRTVLAGAARDLEDPACLPDESRRLGAAAARLPQ